MQTKSKKKVLIGQISNSSGSFPGQQAILSVPLMWVMLLSPSLKVIAKALHKPVNLLTLAAP